MLIINDLPFIFALFALIFGALGVVVSTIPRLQQTMPNLKRDSFIYVLASLLLFMSLFLKKNETFFNTLSANEFNLASIAFAKPLWIQPKVQAAKDQLILAEPELNVELGFVTLRISSDPVAADVFVENVLRGQTPIELDLFVGTPVNYRVVASENDETGLRFAPFESQFDAIDDTELSVWLDRLD